MAAVITMTTNGSSAGTQNTSATNNIKITGDLKGGRVRVLASNEDANYGQVMPDEYFDSFRGRAHVFSMQFSANTYFKVLLDGAIGTPSVRVVMW